MITHIVLIKLKLAIPDETKKLLVEKLKKLKHSIKTIQMWEVGLNIGESSNPGDIVVNSRFNSLEDIQAFRIHPEHVKFKKFLEKFLKISFTVDYETVII